MPTFIVRLELHPSDKESAYGAVHDSMAGAGFSRIYRHGDNVDYHLPAFEYCITSSSPVEAIRDLAAAAAGKVTTHVMLLVSETTRIAIGGLVPVKGARSTSVAGPPPPAVKAA